MLLLLQPLFLLSGVARRTVIVMCKGRVRSAAALEDSTRHVSFSEGAELSIRLQLTLHAVAARGERRLANLIRQLLLLLEPAILLRLYCYTIRLSLVVCTSLLELRIELSRFVIPVVLASLVPTLQRMACGHEAQRTRRRACAQAAAAAWRRRTFLPMSTRPIRLRLFFFGLTTTSTNPSLPHVCAQSLPTELFIWPAAFYQYTYMLMLASPRQAFYLATFFSIQQTSFAPKTGGACLYMPQAGHWLASFEVIGYTQGPG